MTRRARRTPGGMNRRNPARTASRIPHPCPGYGEPRGRPPRPPQPVMEKAAHQRVLDGANDLHRVDRARCAREATASLDGTGHDPLPPPHGGPAKQLLRRLRHGGIFTSPRQVEILQGIHELAQTVHDLPMDRQCRVMDARHYRQAKNGRLSLQPARLCWQTAAGRSDTWEMHGTARHPTAGYVQDAITREAQGNPTLRRPLSIVVETSRPCSAIAATGVCSDHDVSRRSMGPTRLSWVFARVATKGFPRVGVPAMRFVGSCSRRK